VRARPRPHEHPRTGAARLKAPRRTLTGSTLKTTASHPKPPDTSVSGSVSNGKLIRRAEAARLLGVSVSTLRRREGNELQPIVGPDGVHMFDESEVRSVMVTVRRTQTTSTSGTSAGHVAAEVFTLLDAGEHPAEIVKLLKLLPEQVIALRERWSEMRGGFAVTAAQAVELGRLARANAPKDATIALAQLRHRVDAITQMRRGSAKCCVCGDATASICDQCLAVENGPLASFGVNVERRTGSSGTDEVRVCADVYWNKDADGGNVARLRSDWHPVAEAATSEIGDLIAGIERRAVL